MKPIELPIRYLPVIAEPNKGIRHKWYSIFDLKEKKLFVFAENFNCEYIASEVGSCFNLYGLEGIQLDLNKLLN